MKLLSAGLGLFVLLLLAVLLFQHRRTLAIESTLAALQQDRETLASQVKKLDRDIVEQRKRHSAATVPIAAPRTPPSSTTPSASETPKIVPVERPGVTIKAPAGWAKNGSKTDSYVVGVDANESWGGMPSAYVQNLDGSKDGFGGMMQTTSAENYIGKRVRLSGWVKTSEANDGGGRLWLRVDGQQQGHTLQFDNMNNRPVKGTGDWQEASVVLDVPDGASALAYGFFVQGGGKMWVSGARIEEVGPEIPSTNMHTQLRRNLPQTPRNLGFNPNN